MKITYQYHSCYIVETKEKIFLFDYFKGELPRFDLHKEIIAFSSHKHQDHFSLELFSRLSAYEKVTYVLSNEIKMTERYMLRHALPLCLLEKIIYVGKNRDYDLGDGLRVETLTSTDQGVAFLLSYQGKCIYHAGDLNWWTWQGETQQEYEDMTYRFQREIKKLSGRKIDLAFLPLDPRQESRFYLGFDYFMKHTDTECAFPMHMWERYEVIDDLLLLDEAKDYRDKVMRITKSFDVFER